MRSEMIRLYINDLAASLGGISQPADPRPLRTLFNNKDFVGMVRHIRITLRLNLRLRIGFVNSGGPAAAPAWVETPKNLPLYGSREFRQALATIYLRKKFLAEMPFEAVVMAIAHELSHVVLHAIGHRLASCEEAVDLAAMILGFRNFFRIGCQRTEAIKPQSSPLRLDRYFSRRQADEVVILGVVKHQLGYLDTEEVELAWGLMEQMSR